MSIRRRGRERFRPARNPTQKQAVRDISPPAEWVRNRLERLEETPGKNKALSSAALGELPGDIELEPVEAPTPCRPYCLAHTRIQALALLDGFPG